MKIYGALSLAVSALAMTSVRGDSFVDSLTAIPNTDTYHTKPVRVVQARVQGDAPLWNATTSTFGSKYGGDTAEGQFRSAMDTVNTASVEGALMYVQAEGINYNTRSVEDRCSRKNGMKYVVFYDIVFAQTNETVAKYGKEWGPMLPMDGGQCTPLSGSGDTATYSDGCLSLNGTSTVAQIGPFVGGESKATDPRAPYPDCWWYSFPNSCALEKWGSTKTDECRASTRRGLCEMDKLPDGITCTFNYRILGYVPIDDVVGITAMKDEATSETYKDFEEFCEAGGVEFKATEAGVWDESIPFWENPQSSTANAKRSEKLLEAYADLLASGSSSQISSDVVANMQALPTVSELTAANPPCYYNVEACNSEFGCKRENFGQMCTACSSMSDGCVAPEGNFTFPELANAVVTSSSGSTADELSVPSSSTSGSESKASASTSASASASSSASASGSSGSVVTDSSSGVVERTVTTGAAIVSLALFFFAA